MKYFRLAAVAVALLCWTQTARAADAQGTFVIKGPGQLSCQQYADEADKKSELFRYTLAWLTGYLSAYNRVTPETVDIAPWQSTELLADFLRNHCKKHPEMPFAKAVEAMTHALAPHRLRTVSKTIEVTIEGKHFKVYEEVLRRAQQALSDQGYYKGAIDGELNDATKAAFEAFQRANHFKVVTGGPDQLTLFKLLAP